MDKRIQDKDTEERIQDYTKMSVTAMDKRIQDKVMEEEIQVMDTESDLMLLNTELSLIENHLHPKHPKKQ